MFNKIAENEIALQNNELIAQCKRNNSTHSLKLFIVLVGF